MTKRETVISALHAALLGMADTKVLRDAVLPTDLPVGGVVILRDGDPGQPDVTLSPLQYYFTHRAEVEVIVAGKTPAARATAFDELAAKIGVAIEADRTLGGACDWVEANAPAPVDLPMEGAEAWKAAIILIELNYATTSPLG